MEKEILRNIFYKASIAMFFFNFVLYLLMLLDGAIILLPLNFIFLSLFDIFFCIYVFFSVKVEEAGFRKKLVRFFLIYFLFVCFNVLILRLGMFWIGMESGFHFLYLLAVTLQYYFAGWLSKKKHNGLAFLVIFGGMILGIGAVVSFIGILWRIFLRY